MKQAVSTTTRYWLTGSRTLEAESAGHREGHGGSSVPEIPVTQRRSPKAGESSSAQFAYVQTHEPEHRRPTGLLMPGSGTLPRDQGSVMAGEGTDNALDHVVVVMSGNRSLDSVLGRLYGPGDGKTFEGVTGKGLTNPIPEWAGHGADRKKVLYTVAADMNSPNPGTGDEYPHIIHNFLAMQFPLLHPAAPGPVPRSDPDGTQP
jgi:hypothetical protein